jgi:hypothetical protein
MSMCTAGRLCPARDSGEGMRGETRVAQTPHASLAVVGTCAACATCASRPREA